MSNKIDRERKEMQNVFGDPKFARQAWRSVGMAIANSPAMCTPHIVDKNGEISFDSLIEHYSYDKLAKDIALLTKGGEQRPPTELELIMQCQMVRARYDTSAAIFVRDTLGAKPVDETKNEHTMHNPYEELTDEELELLAAHRNGKLSTGSDTNLVDAELTAELTDEERDAQHLARMAEMRPADLREIATYERGEGE